jgi:hypothetical protein
VFKNKSMKYIKAIFWFLVYSPVIFYRRITRKAFYLSGTFLDKKGVRMFYKTTFCTYGNILPIKTIESNMAKYFGVEQTIILYFNRIPYSMVKYVEKDIGIDIDINHHIT